MTFKLLLKGRLSGFANVHLIKSIDSGVRNFNLGFEVGRSVVDLNVQIPKPRFWTNYKQVGGGGSGPI